MSQYTKWLHHGQNQLRTRVHQLARTERGDLRRKLGIGEPDFYAWLRGRDHVLGEARLNAIADALGFAYDLPLPSSRRRGKSA